MYSTGLLVFLIGFRYLLSTEKFIQYNLLAYCYTFYYFKLCKECDMWFYLVFKYLFLILVFHGFVLYLFKEKLDPHLFKRDWRCASGLRHFLSIYINVFLKFFKVPFSKYSF